MQRATPRNAMSTTSCVAAWTAIAASAVAFVLLLSLHVLCPEFSPAWRMISEYANGQYGWVLSLMFVAYGSSELMLALAIAPHVQTRRGRSYPGLVLLILSGAAAASAAQFDINDSTPHELAGIVGILCLPVAAMLISPSLAATRGWHGAKKSILLTANLTWVSVVLWLASFALMIASFVYALGGLPAAPPEELPAGVIAVVGWTNRLMVVSAWCWIAVVAWHIIMLRTRTRASSQENNLGSALPKETVGV